MTTSYNTHMYDTVIQAQRQTTFFSTTHKTQLNTMLSGANNELTLNAIDGLTLGAIDGLTLDAILARAIDGLNLGAIDRWIHTWLN